MVDPIQLERLLAKYRQMAILRARPVRGDTLEERAELRALAHEFPGALRELDRMPTDEIDRRVRALAAAGAGGPCEPWMEWLPAYHTLMRAALLLRRRRVFGLSQDPATELAEVRRVTGLTVDAAFAAAVSAPLRGRLNVVVFARLSDRFAVDPASLADALFPRYG